MLKSLLRVNHLCKYFPVDSGQFSRSKQFVHAVEDVSFSLNTSETLGIVGESGCGKTTTGRLILRLIRPTSGEIFLEDSPNLATLSDHAIRPYRRRMQMVFQDPFSSLNPRMTVGSIIREPLDIHSICPPADRPQQVRKILDEVGLPLSSLNRFPHEFSGGQRQRIGIARALAVDPRLIIADEPVSALDVSIQSQIINLLQELQKRHRLSYLFIAHDLSVVAHISHRVSVMYLGRIVETGTKAELFENPLHPYTKSLMAAIPNLDPHVRQKSALMEGDVPSPANPPAGCPFHPRCNHCMEICRKTPPKPTVFVTNGVEHEVSCHLFSHDKQTLKKTVATTQEE